ncbi:tetratricopeptide repeat protein [Sorangium sp. So ce321]|uniref:tetratricopeptide repeat protein n=1 Tax=Sorangium sp. So ce321 TaxID=3133300 RepID=UPI003F642776
MEVSVLAFEQAGDRRNAWNMRANLGAAYAELGDSEQAESMIRAALAEAEEIHLHELKSAMQTNLAQVLTCRGHLVEARTLAESAMASRARAGLERGWCAPS